MKKQTNPQWKLKTPLYLTKKDNRYAKHAKQLKERGFSDSETWSLYSPIAMFILPRLIRFRELVKGYPFDLTPESWDAMLGDMIFAFDWSLTSDEKSIKMTDDDISAAWTRYENGMNAFANRFRALWW